MGEQKRRRDAGATQDKRPQCNLNTVILDTPVDYRPPTGKVVIIVDEAALGLPVVAVELDADAVDVIVTDYDKLARERGWLKTEGLFFGALADWRRKATNATNQIFAMGLAGVFWLAFGENTQEPSGSRLRRVGRDMQMEQHGTSCLTMAILLRPIEGAHGTSSRTRRWMLQPTPGYMNARELPGAATAH
jgi:hypothetical protein